MGIYGYCINLDERGEFYADLRNAHQETVWEIRVDQGEDIEDVSGGYMRHRRDHQGLETWLKDIGVIEPDAVVMPMMRFEEALDSISDEADEDEDEGGTVSVGPSM